MSKLKEVRGYQGRTEKKEETVNRDVSFNEPRMYGGCTSTLQIFLISNFDP